VVLWAVLNYILYAYAVVLLARLVAEMTRSFAPAWRPAGYAAVGVELVYLTTDPPVKLLRRLIPPLQLGPVRMDLTIIILLLAIVGLRWVVSYYGLSSA
jgi:YggT family protein